MRILNTYLQQTLFEKEWICWEDPPLETRKRVVEMLAILIIDIEDFEDPVEKESENDERED